MTICDPEATPCTVPPMKKVWAESPPPPPHAAKPSIRRVLAVRPIRERKVMALNPGWRNQMKNGGRFSLTRKRLRDAFTLESPDQGVAVSAKRNLLSVHLDARHERVDASTWTPARSGA